MTNLYEMSKVQHINGLWCVMILSAATGKWICQGEWSTKEQADNDRLNWLGQNLVNDYIASRKLTN